MLSTIIRPDTVFLRGITKYLTQTEAHRCRDSAKCKMEVLPPGLCCKYAGWRGNVTTRQAVMGRV